jgi:hypothetical protein
MKIALPKEVLALGAAIRTSRQMIEQHRVDINRANAAAGEAERLNGEIEALSRKRAEHKALAFVAGKPADLAELDRKQDELERASRQAREDGVAAALAVTMLEAKIADIEAEVEQLAEQRKAKTLEWLAAQRESAIDKYLSALSAIGPIIADAMAAEAARRTIAQIGFRGDDPLAEVKAGVYALPKARGKWEKLQSGNDRWVPEPIDWVADREHGKHERDQLFAALTDAEVL